jgi:hypothetical protein
MPRVMLERPRDYKQDLVDLGCKPDDIGAVTWNSVTHSVDVSGSVYLNDKGLTRLPFQFGKVGGSFGCFSNQLTSLEGAPKEVGGSFYCSYSRLTSLNGAPEKVGCDFGCSADGLTDVSALRGCKIKGNIYLSGLRANQDQVTTLLRAQGYKGSIV